MEKEFLDLIAEKKYSRLRELLSELNPADIALILDEIPKKELPVIFRILPKETAAEVFVEMDSDTQQYLIEAFSDAELREVLDELFMDDTVDIIDEMPASVAKRILKQTDAKTRVMINKLLAYPEDSAGSIMTTEYIDLKGDMTVENAFDRIRKIGFETEMIYACYVTDERRKLQGYVTVKDLLLSPKDKLLRDIMDENVIFATTLEDKELVAGQFEKYDLMALPVVDTENRLVGIVTVDDAIDVITEEATEDIDKMAAILPSDKSYFKTGVFSTFKSRVPWLLLLMLSSTFTSAIIANFETKLASCIALVAFIPMLMGTAGNAGSQSSVTIIRAISLGDVKFRDIIRVIWKELRVAFVCGVVLSIINFAKLVLVDHFILHSFDNGLQFIEITVVCTTLFFMIVISKLVGCTLPILAKKIGFDPAVMASPFITTIVDAISLIIYFGVAVALLNL